MLGPVIGNLEQRVRGQPPELAWIRLDPTGIEEQGRRHALSLQHFDQLYVIAAARSAATCVQGERNHSVARGQPSDHLWNSFPPGSWLRARIPPDQGLSRAQARANGSSGAWMR